ncbi:MAG: hypothetical protein ACRDH5_04460 [bacterium]
MAWVRFPDGSRRKVERVDKRAAQKDLDELDALIEELAAEDPGLPARVAAALERRQLLRQLATLRRELGLTHVELAERMGTSQNNSNTSYAGSATQRLERALDVLG